MVKVSKRPLPQEDWEDFYSEICVVLELLESKEEITEFINDLLTYTEKKMLSKRFQIARRLIRRKTYTEICNRLKVTDTTVAHVSEIVESGRGGFERAHELLSQKEKELEKVRAEKISRAIKRSENPVGLKRKG